MCLAIPGKVTAITERDGDRVATVDYGGDLREVSIAYVPDIEVGDYTIVHMGFALQRIDAETAADTLAIFAQMGEAL